MKRITWLLALIFSLSLSLPVMTYAAEKLPPGFIAISDSSMTWEQAKAFCQQKGGKLPRIYNSDSWDGSNPPLRDMLIDGFGYGARPWSEVGLPSAVYWTGTEYTDYPNNSWFVVDFVGKVIPSAVSKSYTYRVACVP